MSLNVILPAFYNDMKSSTVVPLKLEKKMLNILINQYSIPII